LCCMFACPGVTRFHLPVNGTHGHHHKKHHNSMNNIMPNCY
jgi:hypothetical protein